jgi:DNA-binding response OmpR family regulator
VTSLFHSFEFQAQKQNIRYTLEGARDPIELFYDPSVVEKILINLISNAFKFTKSGGFISIGLSVKHGVTNGEFEKDYLMVTVKDSGKGIAAENIERIFDRFYRVDETSFRRPGTGIGLSLVKELAELHHARVEVASAPGEGSTFSLYLPLGSVYQADEMASIEDVVEFTPGEEILVTGESESYQFITEDDSENLHGNNEEFPLLLVVEDNPDICQYIKDIMQDSFRVEIAVDGKDGMAKCEELNPDIVISDIMMPRMDGIQMTRLLKNNPDTCHIPIILLTAKSSEESQIEGLGTGAEDYIIKPFNEQMVKSKVVNIIRSRRMLARRILEGISKPSADIPVAGHDQKFLQAVNETVNANISNADFTTDHLASSAGVSRTLLFNKLKALTGLTGSEIILNARMKAAAEYLNSTDFNIAEICYRTGFSDPKYFSKIFRKHFGKNPTEFRQSS